MVRLLIVKMLILNNEEENFSCVNHFNELISWWDNLRSELLYHKFC